MVEFFLDIQRRLQKAERRNQELTKRNADLLSEIREVQDTLDKYKRQFGELEAIHLPKRTKLPWEKRLQPIFDSAQDTEEEEDHPNKTTDPKI